MFGPKNPLLEVGFIINIIGISLLLFGAWLWLFALFGTLGFMCMLLGDYLTLSIFASHLLSLVLVTAAVIIYVVIYFVTFQFVKYSKQ